MKKFLLPLITATLLWSFPSSAQVVVKIRPAKPKVIVKKPAKAKPGHVWVDGHWRYDKQRKEYVWVKGHWRKARRGQVWVPGHWKEVPGGHKWVPGHWKRRR